MPNPVGAFHLYVVPEGITPSDPLIGVTLKVTPLQTVALKSLMVAIGLTVTTIVNGLDKPQPVVGVTIYVAVTAALLALVKISVKLFTPVNCAFPPLNPDPVGAVQVKVVPDGITPFTPSVGVILNEMPVQEVTVIAFIVATGNIVTVTENTEPTTPLDDGVTKYVAVLAMLVVLVRFPVILFTPVPCEKPPVNPIPVGVVQV